MAERITRTLNFYQLRPKTTDEKYYIECQNAIGEAFIFPRERHKTIFHKDGSVGLYKTPKIYPNHVLATFYYNQGENIPPSMDRKKGTTQELMLEDGEGLGYTTSFLFDRKTNIIAIESNRPGVAVGTLCKFMKNNYDLPSLEAVYVINPAEYSEFLKISTYNRIKVKLAKIQEIGQFLNSDSMSIKEMRDLADKTNSGEMQIFLKAPNRKTSLKNIVSIVKEALRFSDEEELKELVISGYDDDNKAKRVDFFKHKISEKIYIEKQRLIGKFALKEKYEQLEEKYGLHIKNLRIAYPLIRPKK